MKIEKPTFTTNNISKNQVKATDPTTFENHSRTPIDSQKGFDVYDAATASLGRAQIQMDSDSKKQVVEMAKKGKSAGEIHKETGKSKSTILNYLKKENVQTKLQSSRETIQTPAFKTKVVSMYEKGATIKEIARVTEKSRSTIRKILENEGAKSAQIDASPKAQKLVVELAQKGYSIAAIIKEVKKLNEDISYYTVNRILTKEETKTVKQTVLDRINSEEFQNEVIKKFQSGKSVLQISQELKTSDGAILNILNKNGHRTDMQNSLEKVKDPQKINEVLQMAKEGYSQAKIAQATGISKTAVRHILASLND